MSVSINESYNDDTRLADYYLIIKDNIKTIDSLMNEQQNSVNNMSDSVRIMKDSTIPLMSLRNAASKDGIMRLTAVADIIIEPWAEQERIVFKKSIPDVRYKMYSDGQALFDGCRGMSEPTVVNTGAVDEGRITIELYGDDDCVIASCKPIAINLSGIKVAYLHTLTGFREYKNTWGEITRSAATWKALEQTTWGQIKNHNIEKILRGDNHANQ